MQGERMSKKENILESWIMVEHLAEGDINLKDKSIITCRSFTIYVE